MPLGRSAYASGGDASRERWARRAERTYAALREYFATAHGLYREQYPVAADDRAYSFEWPFSQAHVAALDLTGMAGAAAATAMRSLAIGGPNSTTGALPAARVCPASPPT